MTITNEQTVELIKMSIQLLYFSLRTTEIYVAYDIDYFAYGGDFWPVYRSKICRCRNHSWLSGAVSFGHPAPT
jgi:hypothetical protein